MVMVRHLMGGWLVAILISFPLRAADPMEVKTGFDLIPSNAAAGFVVQNLKELKTEGDAFLKNTGLEQKFSLRPSQLFDMAFSFVGLMKGRDDSLPQGVFLANLIEARVLDPSNFPDLEKLLVVSVGVADRDEMAANFNLAKGELEPEQILKITRNNNSSFGQFIYLRGKHLYLGNNERAILSVAQGKPLSGVLTSSQMQRVQKSDLLLHIGTTPWGAAWVKFVQEAKTRVQELKGQDTDPDTGLSVEMLELIADSLPALQNVLIAAGIDDKGLELSTLAIFRPEGQPSAKKLLELLKSGEEASSLSSLPKKRLIAAQAVRSDGSRNRALVRAMLDSFIQFWINEKKLAEFTDRPQFVGLFDEVWQRLKGSQAAVYKNDNPATEGLFSIVAILDTENPQEFLDQMRQLSRFAKPGELKLDGDDKSADDVAAVEQLIKDLGDSNFRVRQSATLKLGLIGPPALPYLEKALKSTDREVVSRARRLQKQIEGAVEARQRDVLSHSLLGNLSAKWGDFPKAETRKGKPIDIVKMVLEGQSQSAETRLKEAFGPEWSKIRLAVHGKKIVVLLGSNVDLLDETLANLDNEQPGLAEDSLLKEFHVRASDNRRVEFHVMLGEVMQLTQAANAAEAAAPEMTSLSLGIDNAMIDLNLWVPNSEVRTLSRFR